MNRIDNGGALLMITAGISFILASLRGEPMWLIVGLACTVIGLKRAGLARTCFCVAPAPSPAE